MERRDFLIGAAAAAAGCYGSGQEPARWPTMGAINDARLLGRPALLLIEDANRSVPDAWRCFVSMSQGTQLELLALAHTAVVSQLELAEWLPEVLCDDDLCGVLVDTSADIAREDAVHPIRVSLGPRPKKPSGQHSSDRDEWAAYVAPLREQLDMVLRADPETRRRRARENRKGVGESAMETIERALRAGSIESADRRGLDAGNWILEELDSGRQPANKAMRQLLREAARMRFRFLDTTNEFENGHCPMCGMGYVNESSKRFLDDYIA